MANTRDTAYRGQTVRLNCEFRKNDVLANPYNIGGVQIRDDNFVYATLSPQFESLGKYYVEWDIPEDQELGYVADVWSGLQFRAGDDPDSVVFRFLVMLDPSESLPTYTPPATYSGLCRVYEYFRQGNGAPLDDVQVYASILAFDETNEPENYPTTQSSYTNSNGRVEFLFPRGATVQVTVPFTGFAIVKTVSDLDEERLTDLENPS